MSDKTILQSLFDEQPSSKGQQRSKNDRAMGLWVQMAKDLDEIAANTRGGIAAVHGGGKGNNKQSSPNGRQGASGSPTPQKGAGAVTARQTRVATARVSSPTGQQSRSLLKAAAKSQGQAIAKATKEALTNMGVTKGKGGPRYRDANGRFAARPDSTARPAQTRSQEAQERKRKERENQEQSHAIADALRNGLGALKGLAKNGVNAVTENSNAKDAVGYALAGPFYAAFKDMKEAIPDSIKDGMSDKLGDLKKGLKGDEKPLATNRDEKGRYIVQKDTLAKQKEEVEIAENELDLQQTEAKKNAKRHKELVRAVRANKRGMTDRLLDRLSFGGGLPGFGRGGRVGRVGGRLGGGGLLGNVGRGGAKAGALAAAGGAAAKGGGLLGRFGKAGALGGKMLGKGALNALKVIPVAGQILAAGMAIYDGFNGWNDKDLHKQAFGLKDGQEATTGQKASAALANVLDMGGLGTGLLGMLGIDVNTADIARGLYDFGNSVANLASEAKEKLATLLPEMWAGIKDIGAKAWEGAQQLGGALSDFASQAFTKGGEILGSMWAGITDFGSGLWNKLTDFASSALDGASKMLGDLWEGVKALPGKVLDGAKDLASSAIDKGGELLSGAWEGIKGAGSKALSWLGPSEAKASTLTPEKMRKYAEEDAKKANMALAPKAENALLAAAAPSIAAANNVEDDDDFTEDTTGTGNIIPFPSQSGLTLSEKAQQTAREEEQKEAMLDLVEINQKQLKLLEDEAAEKLALKKRESGMGDYSDNQPTSTGGGSVTYNEALPAGNYSTSTVGGAALITDGVTAPQNVPLEGRDKRGIRNNNPGNLKLSSEHWEGEIQSTDGVHKQFATPEHGIRAVSKLVANYRKKKGITNLSDFTREYAPSSDKNNPEEYAKFLQARLAEAGINVGVHDAVDFTDPRVNEAMVKGIIRQENTVMPYTDAQIKRGVNAGLGFERLDVATAGGQTVSNGTPTAMAAASNPQAASAMSSIIASGTQDAMRRNIKYNLGSKNMATGQIDCSGWVQKIGNDYMQGINAKAGKEVFSKQAIAAFNKGATNEGAAGILRAVSGYTGELLQDDQLSPDKIREGMVLGTSKGGDSRVAGRFKGIGHVVQTYRDPVTGEMMVSQSTSERKGGDGRAGVKAMTYKEWWANEQRKNKNGTRHIYGADMTKMANAGMLPDATAVASNAASATPASPAAISQINPPTVATPQARQLATESVAQIAPPQNHGPQQVMNTTKMESLLHDILMAIQAGDKKIAAAVGGAGDGTPSIATDFDNKAASQLASDAA